MKKLLLMLMAALLLAGCADTAKKDEPGAAVEERKVGEAKPEAPATPSGAAGDKGPGARELPPPAASTATSPLTDPKNILSKRSVYFDYDSNVVKDEFKPLVEAHARFLVMNAKAKVILQGNADERGSREYNLSLGQRRSDAVKKAMVLLGVPEARIETISFGEEKPRALGSNEEAWAQNRRADIVYEGE